MQPKDEMLVQKAREGDSRAFGRLVEKYQSAVYGLAYYFVRDCDEAQDLSQEAFLHAYLKLSQLKQSAKFASWLRRITANICKMWLRRSKPELISWESLESEHQFAADSLVNSPCETHELRKPFMRRLMRCQRKIG